MELKCPVCGERQLGENISELESNLQGHLTDTHLMDPLVGMPTTLHCPLCGSVIEGQDEEDYSAGLLDHFLLVHDLEPPKVRSPE
jgi:hypothetical protein